MRELHRAYLDGHLSRRSFFQGLVAAGFTTAAAGSMVEAAETGASEVDFEETLEGTSYQASGTGSDLLTEQVRAAGSKYIFTNPGSMESGFFDALTDREDLQVVVGLHEGIVIPMADGFNMVTGIPAFVNVHTVVGTAQSAGQLYNAHSHGSAIIITAALQDTTIYSDDIALAPAPGFSQIETVRQFTKISWEVRNPASAAVAIRRAYKVASTAPGGPVYVAYTRAAFENEASGPIWPGENFLIDARPRPATDKVEALARMLIEASRPRIRFGDEIYRSGAQAEAVELAEMLGLAASGGGALSNFPTLHPQYGASYPGGSPDLTVQFGTRDPGGGSVPSGPRPAEGERYVAVGLDTNDLGRTQALDLSIVANVRETARDLMDAVKSMVTPERLERIRDERLSAILPSVIERKENLLASATPNFNLSPIHPDRLDWELEQHLDPNAIVVEECYTGRINFLNFGYREDQKLRLTKAGSLGWGVGAAIGAKFGAPERQVVLQIGDGALMYSAAGFWTMARHEVPVLTVVNNNHNYQMVRTGFHRLGGRMAETGHYHGMYLGEPEIDFVALAASQGVRGRRVTAASELGDALQEGINETKDGRPYLLEVVISRLGGGAESEWYQKVSVADLQAAADR